MKNDSLGFVRMIAYLAVLSFMSFYLLCLCMWFIYREISFFFSPSISLEAVHNRCPLGILAITDHSYKAPFSSRS